VVIGQDNQIYFGEITDRRYITESEFIKEPTKYGKAYTLTDAPIKNKEFKSQLIEA
jgi:hypothetical protein